MQPIDDCHGTACLLRSGITASYAGHAGAVIAGIGLIHQGLGIGYAAGLFAWACLVYLQIRVSLDAELFTLLANGAEPADLDNFLVRSRLLTSPRQRSIEDRCRGAAALWRKLLTVLVIELVSVGAGLAIGLR
ncbi:MAG: hypothetical protein HYX27_19430 [Acidobacteria bacterium]|nr:hypothetical protein [Acidobacteriota bacterium]